VLPLRWAVLLLALAAGTLHWAPAEQSEPAESPPTQPVYWVAAYSNFSKEPLSDKYLCPLLHGIERQLGRQRCRRAYESWAEIEKAIQNDRGQEALYVVTSPPSRGRPKVVLWARCQDHDGIIAEFPCDPATTGESCAEFAVKDFPSDVSKHDEMCHREKQCRKDSRDFIVP
jgi:hypothetical protein